MGAARQLGTDVSQYYPEGDGAGVATALALTREVEGLFGEGLKYNELRKILLVLFQTAERPACMGLDCIAALQPGQASSSPLTHLFLECISRTAVGSRTVQSFELQLTRSYVEDPLARATALELLRLALRGAAPDTHDPRTVVKIVQTFGVFRGDLDGPSLSELQLYVQGLLDREAYSPAVALILQFEVGALVDRALVARLAARQESLAADLVKHLGEEMKIALAQVATDCGQYKLAYKTVKQFSLYHLFPDAQYLYKEQGLQRMASRGQWDVAEAYADDTEDRRLKLALLRLLLEMEELGRAAELRTRWGLEAEVPVIEACNPDRSMYLPLDVPGERVHWVDSAESLAAVWGRVMEADAVGLDCEWKPNFMRGGGRSRVALLQVGTGEEVALLDMIRLHDECPDELDEALGALLRAPRPLKLGFALSGDLKALGSSYPELSALRQVNGWLELPALWQLCNPASPPPPGGLSGLCRECLGKPLYKGVRTSDWERRPLSGAQVTYAAMDAHCLVLLFRALGALLPSAAPPAAPAWAEQLRNYSVGRRADRALPSAGAGGEHAGARPPPLRAVDVVAALEGAGLADPDSLVELRAAAAEAGGALPPSSLVRSLGMLVDGRMVLLLLGGDRAPDFDKVAGAVGAPRHAVSEATPDECVRLFGFPPEIMPPVGHRYPPLTVLLDRTVWEGRGGGGAGGEKAGGGPGQIGSSAFFCSAGSSDLLYASGAEI